MYQPAHSAGQPSPLRPAQTNGRLIVQAGARKLAGPETGSLRSRCRRIGGRRPGGEVPGGFSPYLDLPDALEGCQRPVPSPGRGLFGHFCPHLARPGHSERPGSRGQSARPSYLCDRYTLFINVRTMTVYAYIRVSTQMQTRESQEFEIRNWCGARGMQIDKWVTESVSGTVDWEKRSLGRAVRRMKSGDELICTELSRLGRNLLMIMSILNFCSRRGIRIHSINDNF